MTDMRSSSSGSVSSSRSFGTRAVTAMFESRSDAEEAVNELAEAGFAREDIRLVPGYEKDSDTGTSAGMSSSSRTSSYTGGVSSGSDTSYRGHEDNRGFW